MPPKPQTSEGTAVLALSAVLAVLLVGVIVSVKVACLALAGIAFVGAFARVVLPGEQAFSVRRRAVDVTGLVLVGLALVFLGVSTPLT